jgi:hypothetical protein
MSNVKLQYKNRTIELTEAEFDIIYEGLSNCRDDEEIAEDADKISDKLYELFKE